MTPDYPLFEPGPTSSSLRLGRVRRTGSVSGWLKGEDERLVPGRRLPRLPNAEELEGWAIVHVESRPVAPGLTQVVVLVEEPDPGDA